MSAPEPTLIQALQQLYDAIARRSPGLPYLNFGFAEPGLERPPGGLPELEAQCRRLYAEVLASLPESGRVLEIGCGRGGGGAFLLETHPALRYLGLDLSPEHVAACRERWAGVERARVVLGDATRLPVASGRFDAAVSIEACHHFSDLGAFYREVRRVLRPGGALLLAGIWEAEVEPAAAMEGAGFRVDERADITGNVVAALGETSALRERLVDGLGLPERFRSFLMSWAGVRGSGSYEELAARERLYLRYRLVGA